MRRLSHITSLIVIVFLLGTAPAAERTSLPATVIVDASEFIDEIPKDDTIADARSIRAEWIFNNFALRLGSNVNVFTKVYAQNDRSRQRRIILSRNALSHVRFYGRRC
jgi:hypothetical protein